MPWEPRFVPAGRMQGANCLIIQERSLHGPATQCGKRSSVCARQTVRGRLREGREDGPHLGFFQACAAEEVLAVGPQAFEILLQKIQPELHIPSV